MSTLSERDRNGWRDFRKPRQYRTERHCRQKQYFADEMCARAGAMDMIQKSPDGVRKLWVYRCKFCPGWHVTSTNGGPAMLVTAVSTA